MSEVRLGIDVACRTDHRASLADERGEFISSSWKFRTTTADLECLWAKIPEDASVTVILEPTRNAWCRCRPGCRHTGHGHLGATRTVGRPAGLLQQTHQDRPVGFAVLARLPLLHPEVCGASTISVRPSHCAGPCVTASAWSSAAAPPASVSTHSSSCSVRLADSLGRPPPRRPPWSYWRNTPIHGRSSVSGAAGCRVVIRSSARLWREDKADELLAMASETLALWSAVGIEFTELAHDIASRSECSASSTTRSPPPTSGSPFSMTRPIPRASSVQRRGSARPLGCHLGQRGDFNRFANLAGVRSFTGFVPKIDQSDW